MSRGLKLLLIGPLPPPIGGVTVLFEYLVEDLKKRQDVSVAVINTLGVRGKGLRGIFHFFGIVLDLLKCIPKADVVSLHAATCGLPIIGPVVYFFVRMFKKPFIVRKFGGTDFRDYGFIRRCVIRWILRGSDLYLAETKMLVDAWEQEGKGKVLWYPNSRPLAAKNIAKKRRKGRCRSFVYLGHVRPVKGVRELISAAERFEEGVSVDVYGPFYEGISDKDFEGLKRVKYCGIITSDKVIDVLSEYDAFVLPTYHPGEGYPGVVLEAYLAGIPVICTRWRALPEIVDDSCGILVEPRNSENLYSAMKKLVDDEQLFEELRKGVKKQLNKFSAEFWNNRFVEYCQELCFKKYH